MPRRDVVRVQLDGALEVALRSVPVPQMVQVKISKKGVHLGAVRIERFRASGSRDRLRIFQLLAARSCMEG